MKKFGFLFSVILTAIAIPGCYNALGYSPINQTIRGVDITNRAAVQEAMKLVLDANPGREINLIFEDVTNGPVWKANNVYYATSTNTNRIVSITLPSDVVGIENGIGTNNNAFSVFKGLKTFNAPGITSVGNYAFHGCKALTTINCSELKSVGDNAFYGCTELITINSSELETIGQQAFDECSSLTTIVGSKITSIGEMAFGSCTSLKTINLPVVTSIGDYAFTDCYTLTDVFFGSTPPSLGSGIFRQTGTGMSPIAIHVPNLGSYTGSPWLALQSGISANSDAGTWGSGHKAIQLVSP